MFFVGKASLKAQIKKGKNEILPFSAVLEILPRKTPFGEMQRELPLPANFQ